MKNGEMQVPCTILTRTKQCSHHAVAHMQLSWPAIVQVQKKSEDCQCGRVLDILSVQAGFGQTKFVKPMQSMGSDS